MKAKVISIEKHPTGNTNMQEARTGESVGLLLEFDTPKIENGTVAQEVEAQFSKSCQ